MYVCIYTCVCIYVYLYTLYWMSFYFPNPFPFLFYSLLQMGGKKFKKKYSEWISAISRGQVCGRLWEDLPDLSCISLTWSGWGHGVCALHFDDTEMPSLKCVKEYLHNSLQLRSKDCVQKIIYFSFRYRWQKVLKASVKTTEALQVLSSKRFQICVYSETQGNWWSSCCFTTD